MSSKANSIWETPKKQINTMVRPKNVHQSFKGEWKGLTMSGGGGGGKKGGLRGVGEMEGEGEGME